MSLIKEGSRDVHDGIIVSMVPDVCLTPQGDLMMPVPYTIWCRQTDAANLANSVRQTDDRSHAVASLVLHCYGDEPGTGGGVFSGTTGAECTPKTWSATVRAEGRNMVRHTDLWRMNHLNTYGKLVYIKDMTKQSSPDIAAISPAMRPAQPTQKSTGAETPQSFQLSQADAGTADGGYCPALPQDRPGFDPFFWSKLTIGISIEMMRAYLEMLRVTETKKQCPPCKTVSGRTVPLGTLAYRHDLVPPSKPHYPFTGDHYNMYKANQYPHPKCDCFWSNVGVEDASGGKPPPAGSIPIEPFVR